MILTYSFFVLILYFFIIYIFWRKFKIAFMLFLPFTYTYTSILISSIYLENTDSYIYEQGVKSFFNGSSITLAIFIIISFTLAITTLQALARKHKIKSNGEKLLSKKILHSVVFLETLLIAHALISGSPALNMGITRFQFWEDYAIIKQLSIFNWLLYSIMFVVGANGAFFLYKENHQLRNLSILTLILAGLYFAVLGNKFSAILLLIFIYFIPGTLSYRIHHHKWHNMKKTATLIGGIFIGATSILIANQYTNFQARELGVFEQLLERVFVLQGHVWWGATTKVMTAGGDYSHALDEIESLIINTPIGNSGMSFLMKTLAPSSLYYDYTNSGVEFTGGFPAINLLTFGLVGGALMTAASWSSFSFLLFYILKLISQGSRIRILFASYLYLNSIVWLQRGSLDGFINWKTITVTILILAIEVLRILPNRKPTRTPTRKLQNGN